MFRIVLIEPEIPQNTGNIARLCAAMGIELVLVGKLGFSLGDKYLKRAGMDYWQHVKFKTIVKIEDYFAEAGDYFFISTKGTKKYTEIPVHTPGCFDIVFGCESSGLPKFIYEKYPDKLYRIPMSEGLRSLNISSSVAIIAYYLIEKADFPGLI